MKKNTVEQVFLIPFLIFNKKNKKRNKISCDGGKDTIPTFVHSPKLALMIGPRTDTQFTGGSAT